MKITVRKCQKETAVIGDFDSLVARFTDRAVVPLLPEKPNKKLIIILAFIASLGFAMVLVLDALNDTIKTSEDVEKLLAQRALVYVPKATIKLTLQYIVKSSRNSQARRLIDPRNSQARRRADFVLLDPRV
jgi:hypothetical protein